MATFDIYADCMYDPAEPWEGLFWNKLLIWVLFFTCLQYSVYCGKFRVRNYQK